jgi:hypothetical protein
VEQDACQLRIKGELRKVRIRIAATLVSCAALLLVAVFAVSNGHTLLGVGLGAVAAAVVGYFFLIPVLSQLPRRATRTADPLVDRSVTL